MAARSLSDEEVVKGLLESKIYNQKVLDNIILKYNREYTEEEEGGEIIDPQNMETIYECDSPTYDKSYSKKKNTQKEEDLDLCIVGFSKGLDEAQGIACISTKRKKEERNDVEFTSALSFFQKVKVENHWEEEDEEELLQNEEEELDEESDYEELEEESDYEELEEEESDYEEDQQHTELHVHTTDYQHQSHHYHHHNDYYTTTHHHHQDFYHYIATTTTNQHRGHCSNCSLSLYGHPQQDPYSRP